MDLTLTSYLSYLLKEDEYYRISITSTVKNLFYDYSLWKGTDITLDVLLMCCVPRCLLALYALFFISVRTIKDRSDLNRYLYPFRNHDANVDAGSSRSSGLISSVDDEDELALEESIYDWFKRFQARSGFITEVYGLLNILFFTVKVLIKLYNEIRLEDEPVSDESSSLAVGDHPHPLWWIAMALSAIFVGIEMFYVDQYCVITATNEIERKENELSSYSDESTRDTDTRTTQSIQSIGIEDGTANESLYTPLLADDSCNCNDEKPYISLTCDQGNNGVGKNCKRTLLKSSNSELPRGIGKDSKTHVEWRDLIGLCRPDLNLILVAFVFLILAAFMQVLIPHFTGIILDALADFDNENQIKSLDDIWQVPGFASNLVKLVIASVLSGLFAGIRYVFLFCQLTTHYLFSTNIYFFA